MSASRRSPHVWLCFGALVGGCDGTPGDPAPDVPVVSETGAELQQGPTVAFDVGIDQVYCAASVRCEPALLVDPFSGHATTTLVLAYTCGVDGTDQLPVGLDVFQSIQRRMTCYDEGDPGDPGSWLPPGGHTVVPLREDNQSGLVNAWGDTQYNVAVLPLDAIGHAFCRFEAWGVFDSTPLATSERAVSHTRDAPVVSWDLVIEGPTPATIDCHLDDGDLSTLRVGNAVSVTYSRPSPLTPGRYPRRESFAIALGAVVHADVGGVAMSAHALRLAYGVDAEFPATADAETGDLLSRDLWVLDSDSGLPIDIAAGRSCAQVAPDGELEAIAIEVLDWWTRAPLGALVVHDTLGDRRFDCDHPDGTSACRLLSLDASADAIARGAGCLIAP